MNGLNWGCTRSYHSLVSTIMREPDLRILTCHLRSTTSTSRLRNGFLENICIYYYVSTDMISACLHNVIFSRALFLDQQWSQRPCTIVTNMPLPSFVRQSAKEMHVPCDPRRNQPWIRWGQLQRRQWPVNSLPSLPVSLPLPRR